MSTVRHSPVDLGLSTSIFGRRPTIEDDLRACRKCGIAQVELCVLPGWIDPADSATLRAVKDWAHAYAVNIHSVHGPSGEPGNSHWLADPDEATRARNVQERIQVMRIARDFGARYVVVEYEAYGTAPYYPLDAPVEQVYPDARDLFQESCDVLVNEAARIGVGLAIENIAGLPCSEMAEMLQGTDENVVGACFDSSHATYGGRLHKELEAIAPCVIGTHLSDNEVPPVPRWKDRHWFPYSGGIDWTSIVGTLLDKSPCTCLMVEVLSVEQRVTPDLVASLDRLRSCIRTCLGDR